MSDLASSLKAEESSTPSTSSPSTSSPFTSSPSTSSPSTSSLEKKIYLKNSEIPSDSFVKSMAEIFDNHILEKKNKNGYVTDLFLKRDEIRDLVVRSYGLLGEDFCFLFNKSARMFFKAHSFLLDDKGEWTACCSFRSINITEDYPPDRIVMFHLGDEIRRDRLCDFVPEFIPRGFEIDWLSQISFWAFGAYLYIPQFVNAWANDFLKMWLLAPEERTIEKTTLLRNICWRDDKSYTPVLKEYTVPFPEKMADSQIRAEIVAIADRLSELHEKYAVGKWKPPPSTPLSRAVDKVIIAAITGEPPEPSNIMEHALIKGIEPVFAGYRDLLTEKGKKQGDGKEEDGGGEDKN